MIQGERHIVRALGLQAIVLGVALVAAVPRSQAVMGATSSFADLNGDGCARAGAGFTNFNQNGPFTLGPPPAAPQPYDSSTCPPGGVCSTAVAAGVAITGGGPLFDTGFVAVLTNGAMTRLPTESCPCTQVNGCPE